MTLFQTCFHLIYSVNSSQSSSAQSIGESGISSDFLDSVMLSPSSENNPLERFSFLNL